MSHPSGLHGDGSGPLVFVATVARSLAGDVNTVAGRVHTGTEGAWRTLSRYLLRTNMTGCPFGIPRTTRAAQVIAAGRALCERGGPAAAALIAASVHDARRFCPDIWVACHLRAVGQRKALLLAGACGYNYGQAAMRRGYALATGNSRMGGGKRRRAALVAFHAQHGIVNRQQATLMKGGGQRGIW